MADVSTPAPEWLEDEDDRALPMALEEGIRAIKRDAGFQDPGRLSGHTGHEQIVQTGASPSTIQGSLAIQEAGLKRWFFPNPGEMDTMESDGIKIRTRFEFRVKRLRFNNVFKRALTGASALPYRNPMTIEGWHESVMQIVSNVDGKGQSATAFTREASERKFFAGIHFAIVEIPEKGEKKPYWLSVPAADWTDWKWNYVDGIARLIEAKVRTPAPSGDLPVDPNDYEPKEDIQGYSVYRAGDPSLEVDTDGFKYSVQRYKASEDGKFEEDGDPIFPGRGRLSDIPAVAYQSDWKEAFRSKPRFSDAAHDQMEIIRQRSELDNMIRKAKAPITIFTGVNDQTYTDQGEVILLHAPGSEGTLLEINAENIKALSEEIDKGEAKLGLACMDPLTERVDSPPTATEVADREMRTASWLEVSARSDQDATRRLLVYTTLILGLEVPESAKATLPTGFMEVFKSQHKMANLYREMAKDGALSIETLWELLRNLEVGVEEDFDAKGEVARIKSERATARPTVALKAIPTAEPINEE